MNVSIDALSPRREHSILTAVLTQSYVYNVALSSTSFNSQTIYCSIYSLTSSMSKNRRYAQQKQQHIVTLRGDVITNLLNFYVLRYYPKLHVKETFQPLESGCCGKNHSSKPAKFVGFI